MVDAAALKARAKGSLGRIGPGGKIPGKTHPPTPMDQHQEPDGDEGQQDPNADPNAPAEGQPHPAYEQLQAEAQKSGAHIHPQAQLAGLDHDGASKVLKRDGHTDVNGHTQNLDIRPIQDTAHHATICTHCQHDAGLGANGDAGDEPVDGEGSDLDENGMPVGQNAGAVPPRVGDSTK
jgi:hypothetical protein